MSFTSFDVLGALFLNTTSAPFSFSFWGSDDMDLSLDIYILSQMILLFFSAFPSYFLSIASFSHLLLFSSSSPFFAVSHLII